MDVTRSNFSKAVTAVESVLPEADFVAIDLEFTGLYTTVSNDFLDTFEQVYQKGRDNMSQFQIIQLGLSIFKATVNSGEDKKGSGEEFDCHSFNFYIFPRTCRQLERQAKERYFLSQASSLEFLAGQGFDFNKLIKDGVSYLNLAQARLVKEKLAEQRSSNLNREDRITITDAADKEFVGEVMRQIAEFAGDSKQTELALPNANAFRRRLMHEALADSPFAETIELAGSSADRMKLTARRTSPELRQDRERATLLEAVGFSEVIKLLLAHRKPLVGHNLYLDLLYIFNAFIEPLPESYDDFKKYFHSLFPLVYDTRFLSANNIIGAMVGMNSLENLYPAVQKSPFLPTTIHLKNLAGTEEKDKLRRAHQAGYDSYMTGVAFINIVRYLIAQELNTPTPENLFDNPLLAPYRNRVGIFRTLDLRCMNLEAADRLPDRMHVFHITFPSEWKTSNINALFTGTEIGGLQAVTYIDDQNAFVTLKEPGSAVKVLKELVLKPSGQLPAPFKVQTYGDYMKRKFAAQKAPAASSPADSQTQQETKGKKSRLSGSGDYSDLLQPATLAAASNAVTSPPLQKIKKIKTDQEQQQQKKSDEKTQDGGSKAAAVVNGTAEAAEASGDNVSSAINSNGIASLITKRLNKKKSCVEEDEESPESLFDIPNWAQ